MLRVARMKAMMAEQVAADLDDVSRETKRERKNRKKKKKKKKQRA
jgi:hypothetical protein